MGVIWFYILVCLTTAIAALYEIYFPVMRQLDIINPDNVVAQNKILGYTTMFLASILFTPVIFFAVIIPSWGENFRQSMLKSLVD